MSTILVFALMLVPAAAIFFICSLAFFIATNLLPQKTRRAHSAIASLISICISLFCSVYFYKPAMALLVRNTIDKNYTLTQPQKTISSSDIVNSEIQTLVNTNPALRQFCTEPSPCTYKAKYDNKLYQFWGY